MLSLQQRPALVHSSESTLQKDMKLHNKCGGRQLPQCVSVPDPHYHLPAATELNGTSCPAAPHWGSRARQGRAVTVQIGACGCTPTSGLRKGKLNYQQRHQWQDSNLTLGRKVGPLAFSLKAATIL